MKHVLVTGGAGFVGSHTVEALLAQGCRVTVLDNLSNGQRANLCPAALVSGQLSLTVGDVRDTSVVDATVRGCDAVLHLAAQVSVQSSVAEPVASASHNVTGFLNVLDAVRRHRVPRLVYASSAAVYGIPDELPLTEASRPAPLSPYGLEKLINDQYAKLHHTLYGVSVVGMRYFNIYGPKQDPKSPYSGVISRFADGLESGTTLRVFGDGMQTRDFVYVGDVAQANVRALGANIQGVLNIGTGQSVTLMQLIDAMAKAFGKTPQVQHEPSASGDIVHSATSTLRLADALAWLPATALVNGLKVLATSLRNT